MAGDRGVSSCILCLKENKLSLCHLFPETSPHLHGRMAHVLMLCVVVPCADCEVSASATEAGRTLGNKDTARGIQALKMSAYVALGAWVSLKKLLDATEA